MFDAIAPRYDLLNHVLSAGLDRGWRDRAVEALQLPENARVLDVCTGTADLAIATVTRARGASVVGVDFAQEMLRLGLAKVRDAGLDRRVRLYDVMQFLAQNRELGALRAHPGRIPRSRRPLRRRIQEEREGWSH